MIGKSFNTLASVIEYVQISNIRTFKFSLKNQNIKNDPTRINKNGTKGSNRKGGGAVKITTPVSHKAFSYVLLRLRQGLSIVVL